MNFLTGHLLQEVGRNEVQMYELRDDQAPINAPTTMLACQSMGTRGMSTDLTEATGMCKYTVLPLYLAQQQWQLRCIVRADGWNNST